MCTFCFATGRGSFRKREGGSSRLRTFLYTVEFTRKFQPFNKEGARNLMKDSQFLRGILHHFFIQNFPLKFSDVTASRVFLCAGCSVEPKFATRARNSTKSGVIDEITTSRNFRFRIRQFANGSTGIMFMFSDKRSASCPIPGYIK